MAKIVLAFFDRVHIASFILFDTWFLYLIDKDLSLSVLMKLLKLECETAVGFQQSRVFPLHVFKVFFSELFNG